MSPASRRRRSPITAWPALLLVSSLMTSVQAGESTVAYPVIQRAFLREDFELVARLSPTFLSQHSDASEVGRVWLWFALSLDRLQRPAEALKEFDALKRELPREDALWPEVLFWDGEVSRRALQMIRAKSAYEQLLESAPTSPWALQARLGLGLIYLHQQAFERALAHFKDLTARGSSMSSLAVNARLLEGFCQLRLEHFEDAVTCLEPLLQSLQYPQLVAQAAFYVGESFSALGRFEEAARAYQRALEGSDTSRWGHMARFGLGWVYAKMNRCEESVEAFEQYLTPIDEDSSHVGALEGQTVAEAPQAEAWLVQGQCLARLGRDEEALARFERIMVNDVDAPVAVEGGLMAIDLYRRQGRFSQAKDVVHALLRRPITPIVRGRLHMQLGVLALEQGNVAQARTVFRLVAQSPQRTMQSSALSGLGDVQRLLGELSTAQQFYEEAVRVADDPSMTAVAWFQLGRLHAQRGAFTQAVTTFQHLIAGDHEAVADEARLALVTTYLNQHEEALARVLLDTMRRMRPTSLVAARAAYYQALLALEEGKEELAKSLCQETMTNAKGTDEAIEAQLLFIDLETRAGPVSEMVARLQQGYASSSTRPSAQAKFAKRLGDMTRNRQAYDEAIRWYERAATLSPTLRAELTYQMASCYEEAGDRDLAIQWYQRIDQAPWRVKGQLAAAKLLEREERWRQAREIYLALMQEAIPEAKVARERLASIGNQ